MTDESKKPYDDKASGDKERRNKQMAELKQKGFFTLDDGTKSTDPSNKNKLSRSKSKTKTQATQTKDPLKQSEESIATNKKRAPQDSQRVVLQ